MPTQFRRRVLALLLVAASCPSLAPAASQPGPPAGNMPSDFKFTRIAAPDQPGAIPLYADAPSSTPGAAEIWDTMGNGQRIVRNVAIPTITPFLPDPAKATGAAVIVAPGGGFKMLSMDNEGWPVAKWLADHGIAAFVLKYRVNSTNPDEQAFMGEMGAVFAAALSAGGHPPDAKEPRATADALQALKIVRAGAGRWGVDPGRVGMIGFSAGAMTTMRSVLDATSEQRPAFIGYIYGPMATMDVPAGAPPMFAALALDDGLFGRQGFGIVEAWHKANRPVELHAYEKGDHGFGMGKPGTTTTLLMDEFRAWLESRGLLKKGPAG
ncbi:MAG: dienelactone hydrolase family protein [Alphaproteobacteria bacterium]|nr:dienelactone hydrolase family protein [Alphaproteobacteria bacterium]